MKKVALFDTKPYDREWFNRLNTQYDITYFESKLSVQTAQLAKGFDAVCAFVNDTLDARTIELLTQEGVQVVAMRCSGYNNVDMKAAYGKLHILRVPVYSPYAVAEHTMGLLLCLNRKIHRAYNRTRDFNFSLNGLTGVDLHDRTAGIIGTGNIGRIFLRLCSGFGMRTIAYDPYPQINEEEINYVDLPTLLRESDVISLHCPLTEESHHILNRTAFSQMKKGVFILNTSRGSLIDSSALLEALNKEIVRGAGLDVYEEEADLFFEDFSGSIIHDDTLALLVSHPNVLITSHQAFLTEEALGNIVRVTLGNLDAYFSGAPLGNEICYYCKAGKNSEECKKKKGQRCF